MAIRLGLSINQSILKNKFANIGSMYCYVSYVRLYTLWLYIPFEKNNNFGSLQRCGHIGGEREKESKTIRI